MNERILIDPKICHGKPLIGSTGIPVTVILHALARGDDYETLQRNYSITAEDIRACLAFAAAELDQITCLPQPVEIDRAERVRQLQQRFAEWTEEDSKLSADEADRLRMALEANHGLTFHSAELG